MDTDTASTVSTPSKIQRFSFSDDKSAESLKCFENNARENSYQKIISILYIYSSLHGCIDQLIPTSYKVLETSIGLSPKSLGLLTFAQKFTQGLFTLISGMLCDKHINIVSNPNNFEYEPLVTLEENLSEKSEQNRRNYEFLKIWPIYFMLITTIGWGMIMVSMIFADNVVQMLVLLCLLGIFMSLMGPLTQSVIGTFSNIGRSEHFGNVFLAQNIGRIFCISATANIMGQFFDFNWVLLMFSLMSFLFSIYLYKVLIKNTNNSKSNKQNLSLELYNTNLFTNLEFYQISCFNDNSGKSFFRSLEEYYYIFYNKSAWLMLIMGIINGIPRHSLNFTMMWLQYCGLSPLLSTIIYSSSWISAILVSPFVGKVSDYIESKYPSIGRQFLAQFTIFIRIILMLILLRYIPWGNNYFFYYLILSILIGFMAGWPGVGANRPILCQIVKPNHRATLFAFFSLFETIGSASFGAPLVGILAQNYFGYNSSLKKDISEIISRNNPLEIHILKINANALANSMICMTIIPWILTIILFGLLTLTYHNDQNSDEEIH